VQSIAQYTDLYSIWQLQCRYTVLQWWSLTKEFCVCVFGGGGPLVIELVKQ